jgi:S-adenosylmethionine hydrolase
VTPIVTFTSDFGLEDWFVGVVHGVIHELCPAAHVVDLTHAIPPGDLARAAFVLEAACPDFPAGTIHLVVVDPGVGTARRAIAVRARGQRFVGPDNGVLEWALSDPQAECREITETRFFRPDVSRTFHGRDVFAPVAAHLAGGAKFEDLGRIARDPVRQHHPDPLTVNGGIVGEVVLVDRFGNALTNIAAGVIAAAFRGVPESKLEVDVAGRTVSGIARSYGDAPIGTLVAIIGSSGRLELAEVGGHASSRFGIGARDAVRVRAAD